MLSEGPSDVRGYKKRLGAPFCAGKLFLDYGEGSEVAYVLDLNDERVNPVCCCDLDERVATVSRTRFRVRNLAVETSGAREGSKSFLHHLGFANGKTRAHESPYPCTQNNIVHDS